MDGDVGAVPQFAHQRWVEGRADADAESRPTFQMLDVRHASGGEIVERDHLISPIEQPLGEMGANESGAAGDEDFHRRAGSRAPVCAEGLRFAPFRKLASARASERLWRVLSAPPKGNAMRSD